MRSRRRSCPLTSRGCASRSAEVLDAGARMIHVDVMDGHFVPPITVGPLVVAALREQVGAAGAMLDVHLMIERPERHVADFVQAGADSITFHAEATPHVAYTADLIRQSGAGVGVAINPGDAGRRAGRGGGPAGHGAVHDRQPRLGRAAVHRAFAAEDRARPRDRRRGRGRRGGRGHRSRHCARVQAGRRERVRGRLGDLLIARPG